MAFAFIAGLGLAELSVILLLVLILFGAGRLPSVLEALGKGVRALRQATSEDDPEPGKITKT